MIRELEGLVSPQDERFKIFDRNQTTTVQYKREFLTVSWAGNSGFSSIQLPPVFSESSDFYSAIRVPYDIHFTDPADK